VRFKIGDLEVEAGGVRHRRLGVWWPDGLHIWLGSCGVHIYWSRSPYMPRITFDRLEQS
jgi:hypothetical protein